jgi:hypothetical protein
MRAGILYESLTLDGDRLYRGDKASDNLKILNRDSAASARRLTPSQFTIDLSELGCVNVGIVYVHSLSVKSNSPESPLRHVPIRHTVYFLFRDPYYAVAERWRELPPHRAERSGATPPWLPTAK